MDGKQIRNLVTMILVLAVCVAGYFGMKSFKEKTEAAEKEATEEVKTELFASVSEDDIESISWKYEGEDVSISKGEKDVWFYDSVSLNEGKPASWKSDITGLSATNTITGDDVKLDSFGLTEPSNVITAKLKDGKTVSIALGIQNEITNEYYCYINDDKSTVYTISSTLANDFNTSPKDYLADKTE